MMQGYTKVGDVMVDNAIFTTYFSCDYKSCKGACCWATLEDIELDGGSLLQTEAQFIREYKRKVSEFVDEKFKPKVLAKPVYQRGSLYFTSMDKETGGCLYSNTECKTCTFKVMKDKDYPIDIPVKCALYPLWVEERKDVTYLSLIDTFEDKFCKPALEKGERDRVLVYNFCEDAVTRFFGEDFFTALQDAASMVHLQE